MAWEDIVADRSGIGKLSFALDCQVRDVGLIISKLEKIKNDISSNWGSVDNTVSNALAEFDNNKNKLIVYRDYLDNCLNALQKVYDMYEELDTMYFDAVSVIE